MTKIISSPKSESAGYVGDFQTFACSPFPTSVNVEKETVPFKSISSLTPLS